MRNLIASCVLGAEVGGESIVGYIYINHNQSSIDQSKVITKPHTGKEKPHPSTAQRAANLAPCVTRWLYHTLGYRGGYSAHHGTRAGIPQGGDRCRVIAAPQSSKPAMSFLRPWAAGVDPGLGLTQSINHNQILKAPHEHKRSHIPAQPHGQQTPRREASQAWGAKSESRKR